MDFGTIRVGPLGASHDRSGFSCGVPALDRYLQQQTSQDARRRVAAPFVASTDGVRVLGFYTLSATSIQLTDVPAELATKLPRYPRLPATLLAAIIHQPGALPCRGRRFSRDGCASVRVRCHVESGLLAA